MIIILILTMMIKILEPLGVISGPLWGILEPWGLWGAPLGHLEASWGPLGSLLGALENPLRASRGHLGPSWSYLGPSWGHLGRILGISSHLGAILAPSCATGCPRRLGSMGLGIFNPILGSILRPEISPFLVILGVIFWISFWTNVGPLLGSF